MAEFTALLVDDEFDFVSTLAERLQLRGVKTIVCTDGVEALELIDQHRPPLVVLDVMMPGMGGLEVLKLIKARYAGTQVILLTGRGLTKNGIEGMRMGAFDYLVKPVHIEELLQKMNEAVESAGGG